MDFLKIMTLGDSGHAPLQCIPIHKGKTSVWSESCNMRACPKKE